MRKLSHAVQPADTHIPIAQCVHIITSYLMSMTHIRNIALHLVYFVGVRGMETKPWLATNPIKGFMKAQNAFKTRQQL